MGARHAALGVIDRSGRQLERFPGMSVRVREAVEREAGGNEGRWRRRKPDQGSGELTESRGSHRVLSMAKLEKLLAAIENPKLREQLIREVRDLKDRTRFDLATSAMSEAGRRGSAT